MSYLFAFSYCSWGSQGKNIEVVCHSLLQWTTFCQNSPPWPIHLGWPYMAWFIVSLSETRLRSTWHHTYAAAAAKSLQSCPTLRPHRRQPNRLPRPWDSPGKNTGVGCHFLLQCLKVKSESEVIQSCPTLSDLMDCSLTGSSIHGIFQTIVLEWGAIAFSILMLA